MRPARRCLVTIAFLVAAGGSTLLNGGCASEDASAPELRDPSVEQVREHPGVSLDATSMGDGTVSLTVNYRAIAGAQGPRVVENHISVSPNFRFASGTVGAAAEAAEKRFIAQPQEDGTVRVILLASTNANGIGSGELYSLQFERTADGAFEAAFAKTDSPMFAPASALEGLEIGEGVTLRD